MRRLTVKPAIALIVALVALGDFGMSARPAFAAPTMPSITTRTSPNNQVVTTGGFTKDRDITFTFTTTGGGLGLHFVCSVDGVTTNPCPSPFTVTGASVGPQHTLTVRADDATGQSPTRTFFWTVDQTAPTVSMATPANGATVSGASVNLTATAADNSGSTITVNYLLDGTTTLGGNSTSPYTAIWNTTTTPNGTHTLAATARDRAANSTTSAVITITIANPNPVPVMGGINPAAQTTGAGAFTMTVTGSGFVSGSIVRMDGSDRTTAFVSPTQLSASIPASDTAAAGTHSVTVFNPAPGGGTSGATTFSVNNPAPTLASISPSSKTVGSAAFTMFVNGSGFVASSVARLNGSNRPTTFVSATQLSVAIPASDMAVAGSFAVTVSNPAPGGGISGAQTFSVTAAAPPSDTTPPTLAQVTPVPTPSTDTTPSYTFSSTEAGTIGYGGPCSAGTIAAVAGNNTVTFNALSPGTYSTCVIRVRDAAGNTSAALTVNTFVITAPADTTAPTGTVSVNGGATSTTSSAVTLTLTCNDAVGCTQMQIGPDGTADTEPFVAFAANANATLLPSGTGTRTVAVRFRDAAGNTSAAATDAILVTAADTTAPTGSVVIENGAASTTSSAITLTITCNDAVGCTQMQVAGDGNVDSEPVVPFSTTATATLSSGTGTRTAAVKLLDAAGNGTTVTDSINVVNPPAPPPPPPSAPPNLPSGFIPSAPFCAGSIVGTSSICGDAVKGVNESCEIGEVQVSDCSPSSLGRINEACINDNGTCRFQTEAEAKAKGAQCVPAACGNGVREGSEQCDDGAQNGTINHCGADCTTAGSIGCGDGFLAGAEQCDCGTPQNFSSLPASSWAKTSPHICAVANGQYAATGLTCTFDCKLPGLSCGDRVVNGPEVCDGNSETTSTDANGQPCPTNTTRTRTCNASCSGFGNFSACGATCGNGKTEGNEQCDDGNAIETDGCTNACKLNVCGDNKLFAGKEACDDGAQNGTACTAPYGGVCNYCTPSCQLVTKSGGFCGDGVIDAGHEFCDGAAPLPRSCVNLTTRDRLSTCTDTTDCRAQVDVAIAQGTAVGPRTAWSCIDAGVCNGGTHNGETCTATGLITCGSGGSCVAQKCDNTCAASCPFALQTVPIQVLSEVPGSSPGNAVDLFSFQNENGSTPDNATLFLPACSVGTKLIADVDKSKVVPPLLDIVFITDLSQSMDTLTSGAGSPSRIQVVRDSTNQAIDNFIDGYAEFPSSRLRIGLVTFQGTTATKFDGGAMHDASSSSALHAEVNSYPARTSGGTPTDKGLIAANEMLAGSDADTKVVILLSDGDPTPPAATVVNAIKEATCTSNCGHQIHQDIQYYSAAVASSTTLIGTMKHFSTDLCGVTYTSQNDCGLNAGVEYAFHGTDAAGISAMYRAVTDSVLGANVGITATGGGGTSQTSGAVPAGKSVILPFPTNFVCTGAAMQLPLNVTFNSSPSRPSTINVSNVKFEYCPTH